MNIIPKKITAAIEAVLYIACINEDRPVRSSEICKYQNVKLRYLETIMQVLVHYGILKGVRGPKGGYYLARERRKIRLSDIYDSIVALEAKENSISEDSELYNNVIRLLKAEISENIRNYLSSVTIDNLYEKARSAGINITKSSKSSFDI